MTQKPFEVAAECAMSSLPTGGDIARVGDRLEQQRHRAPGVVRAAVQGPAAFKDRTYVLESRFVVWADDGEGALRVVEQLLDGAKITHRGMHLSGRALTEADAPRPSRSDGSSARGGETRTAPRRPAKEEARRAPARPTRPARSRAATSRAATSRATTKAGRGRAAGKGGKTRRGRRR